MIKANQIVLRDESSDIDELEENIDMFEVVRGIFIVEDFTAVTYEEGVSLCESGEKVYVTHVYPTHVGLFFTGNITWHVTNLNEASQVAGMVSMFDSPTTVGKLIVSLHDD